MVNNQAYFVCDHCCRTFTRKYNLQTHIENYHMNSSCYCEICDQRFGTPAGLQLHLSRGHNRYGQAFPECDICGRIFTRKQNITSHMLTVHMEGVRPDIRCRLCNKTFTTHRNLKRHINQLHNPYIKYPTCDECNKSFKGKHSLIAHIQSNHNVTEKDLIKCRLCDKVYTNKRNLKRHMEMFHGERGKFRCDMCPKVYTSNQSLKRHRKTMHNPKNQSQFQCKFCYETIIGKDNFDNHVKSYHNEDEKGLNEDDSFDFRTKSGEWICSNCNSTFKEEPQLRSHVKLKHSFQDFYDYCKRSLLKLTKDKVNTQRSNYSCEFCRETLSSILDLKDHMKSNHDVDYRLSNCNVCFNKFYCRETMSEHKKICLPPADVNSCNRCDKLFTDISSLEFHTRIFHPQSQIADTLISSTNIEESSDQGSYKCVHCNRAYYSERSLKNHVKLKHTTDEAVECEICQKICSNKYYLASHIKIVHSNDSLSKCPYCSKQFKSKRNIRRHVEFTHLGKQRYKCIECETLFKEKRSLRKHVRIKHPNSATFPQCHICHKRFESAKSCKIHLKLLHSFNMNTHPCDRCSVSFDSIEALNIHLELKHLAENAIYKCEECNLVFNGHENFAKHNELSHVTLINSVKQKVLPSCVLCAKEFSTRKTLKRHILKFHEEFDVDELVAFGGRLSATNVDCGDCVKSLNDEFNFYVYQEMKHLRGSVIFKCKKCLSSYNALEYSILRYKLNNRDASKSKLILSELCTAEIRDDAVTAQGCAVLMEPESTTCDIKLEPPDLCEVKIEPVSP